MRLRTALIELLACLAVAAAAAAETAALAIADEQERFWTEVISNDNFGALLDAAASGEASWPKVVSARHAGVEREPETAAAQERFRDLAVRLTEGLDRFRSDLENLDSKTFLKHTSQLLDLRTRLSERPSYVNLLLADVIHRVLFIELAKYMVTHGEVDDAVEQRIATLGEFAVDLPTLADLVGEERGTPISLSGEGYENDVGMDPRDPRLAFSHLAEEVAGDVMLVLFAGRDDVKSVTTLYLLKDRNLTNLLYRLWRTDHMIHIVLPLTAEYVRKADQPSSADGHDKVRSTLALTREIRSAYDTDWNLAQPTVPSDIAHVLAAIHTGKIDDLAAFGTAATAMSSHDKEGMKR